MPNLAEFQEMSINILLMGDPGVGKSSACASLANHGYEVGILDLDGHPQSILDPKIVTKENRKNIFIEQVGLNDPNGWAKCLNLIDKGNWGGWGPPTKWPSNRVFVLDSGSFLSTHALVASLIDSGYTMEDFYKGKHNKGRDAIRVYQSVGSRVTRAIQKLCAAPCPFIATFHIRDIQDENRFTRRKIATEGNRASDEIPKLFGDIWEVDVNSKGERFINTKADKDTIRKNSLPSHIEDKIPLDLGPVFDIFSKSLKGEF